MILGSIRYRYNIDVLIDTKPVSSDYFYFYINCVYKSLAKGDPFMFYPTNIGLIRCTKYLFRYFTCSKQYNVCYIFYTFILK
jgi:hypothetical protein